MPRAPKLTDYNEREFKLSREFLKDALESVVKQKFTMHANGVWLENVADKSTVNTYLVQPPHPQTGMVKFSLDRGWNPLFGKAAEEQAVIWLVLHDPHANRVKRLAAKR